MFVSIRYKFIAVFLATSIIPIFLLGGFAYVETYDAVKNSEQLRLEEEVKNIVNSMNIALEDTQNIMLNLATTPSISNLLQNYSMSGKTTTSTVSEVSLTLRKIYVEANGIYDNMLVVDCDGNVLADSWNGKYVGQSLRGEAYLKHAIKNKVFVIGDVSYSSLSQTSVKFPTISMAQPVLERNGRVLGAIIISYDLNFFTRHLYNSSFNKSGFGYMVNSSGQVLYSKDDKEVMKFSHLPEIEKTLVQVKMDLSKYRKGSGKAVIKKQEHVFMYQVVPKSKWVVACFVPKDRLFASANWIRETTVRVILATGLISMLLAILLVRNITGSLNEMAALLKRVEKGDYTNHCTIRSRDEFENLGKAFNQMVDEKNLYVGRIVNTARRLEGVSGTLNGLVKKIKRDIGEISDVTHEVSAGAETNQENIQGLHSAMNHIVNQIKVIRAASENAVTVSRKAVASATKGERAVNEAVNSMTDIESSAKESTRSLGELSLAMEKITSFIEIIKNIASETNLIALNAAIQAAHAGQQGSAFGVVAERIKSLSEESSCAAKEIDAIIKDIKEREGKLLNDMKMVEKDVKNGLDRADLTVNGLKGIIREVKINEDIIEAILISVEEQLTSIEDISRNMDNIRQITNETSKGTGVIAGRITHEVNVVGNIAETSNEMQNLAGQLYDIVSVLKYIENEAVAADED